MSTSTTIDLPANHQLTVTAGSGSSGRYHRIIPGEDSSDFTTVAASSVSEAGPFSESRQYKIVSEVGLLTTSCQLSVGGGGGDAEDVAYDNSTSGLTATDTQGAIDELDGTIDALPGGHDALTLNGDDPTQESLDLLGQVLQINLATTLAAGAMPGPDKFKLDGIESLATADQTGAQIKTAYEGESDTNAFTDAEQTKLTGIEASADVTDETNVTTALDGATLTGVTVAGTDKVLLQDVDDSDNLKTVTAQSIADLGGGGLANVVEDTTPQLGGDLDANGNYVAFDTGTGIKDENGNEQIHFITTASAINCVEVTNAATGGNVQIASRGDDTNVGMSFDTKAAGSLNLATGAVIRADITAAGMRLGNANSRVTTILDEDAMGTDSATALATQQSIKAYVDSQSGSSPGVVQISTATAAGDSEITFTGLNATYIDYFVVISDMVPATDGTRLQFQVSIDNGSTYRSTAGDYQHTQLTHNSADTTVTVNQGNNQTVIILTLSGGMGNVGNEALSGRVNIHNPNSTTEVTKVTSDVVYHDASADFFHCIGGSVYKGTTDNVDAIRFFMNSGNISTGIFTLYGVTA